MLNAGWFYDPDYEWGVASSPIIWKDLVIVQCDIQKSRSSPRSTSKTGKPVWRTQRDEIPVWRTPTIYRGRRPHASSSRRPRTSSAATTRRRARSCGGSERQLRGHRPDADRRERTDLRHQRLSRRAADLRDQARREGRHHAEGRGDDERRHRVEHEARRAVHSDAGHLRRLSVCAASTTACWRRTRHAPASASYQERLGGKGGSFSASPVAADGKIYLASEDGDVFVVKAGPTYELLATNRWARC